jgi:hypothetical protein
MEIEEYICCGSEYRHIIDFESVILGCGQGRYVCKICRNYAWENSFLKKVQIKTEKTLRFNSTVQRIRTSYIFNCLFEYLKSNF